MKLRQLSCSGMILLMGLAFVVEADEPLQRRIQRKKADAQASGGATLLSAEVLEQLKLTTEQKQSFDKVDQDFQQKHKVIQLKLDAAKKERDRNKYNEAIKAQTKLRPDSLTTLDSVLTDAQKKTLAAVRGQDVRPRPKSDDSQKKKSQRAPDLLQTGDAAPDFSVQDVAGKKTVKLSDLKGKPIVLIFGSCT